MSLGIVFKPCNVFLDVFKSVYAAVYAFPACFKNKQTIVTVNMKFCRTFAAFSHKNAYAQNCMEITSSGHDNHI